MLGELPPSSVEEIGAGKLPEALKAYQHQQVSIRGFVYRTKDGKNVLAAEPDLKSCCVASRENILRQVMLEGDEIAFLNNGRAQEVQGRFEIEPLKNENGSWKKIFVLQDALVIKKKPERPLGLLYLITGFTFTIVIFLFLYKEKIMNIFFN
ncbi:MAG: hypothetical protein H0X29_01480 [Parachlamydiaceae bacterium]|nr:hypothetical protein [Parachlamydiaceae bacterium]